MALKTLRTLTLLLAVTSLQPSWAQEGLDKKGADQEDVEQESFAQRADAVNQQTLSPQLSEQGWRLLGLDDVPATEFALTEHGIRIAANASNALIYRELNNDDSVAEDWTQATLRWSWRVDQLPSSKTLRKVADDDRAIAVYIAFEIDQRNLSLWGRIRSSVVALFSGLPKGQILTYVWGKDDATDEWFPNPLSLIHI